MTENELAHQLLDGLKQLDGNLKLLYSLHEHRGLDTSEAYTQNTVNIAARHYVDSALDALHAFQGVIPSEAKS